MGRIVVDVMSRLEELEAEVRIYREAFTAMEYAKRIERFHALDSIRNDTCPACSSPVKVVEGPLYPGELSPHGTQISPNAVRLVPRA